MRYTYPLQDVVVAESSVAHVALSEGGSTLLVSPAAVGRFATAAHDVQLAAAGTAARPLSLPATGNAEAVSSAGCSSSPNPADRCALLADYASGVVEVQRAMQRLQAGGMPYVVGGTVGLTSAVVGGGGGGTLDVGSDLAERSRISQQLHRLLYAEAVLGQLFQRCEDISDSLEATSQVLRFMARGLDEVCGW
jgi:hypothetical protein